MPVADTVKTVQGRISVPVFLLYQPSMMGANLILMFGSLLMVV